MPPPFPIRQLPESTRPAWRYAFGLPSSPAAPALSAPSPRAAVYVGTGVALGAAYALLNSQTDVWARGAIGRAFVAFHLFVDRGIPVVVGALAGLSFHWLFLRARLARTEALRAEELRARLRHVERDQAAWVVAAAALHELKNPLHALGLLIDELEHAVNEGDRAAATEEMGRVREELGRALVPLNGLRALTRPVGMGTLDRSVAETVERVVAALSPIAETSGVALVLERVPAGAGERRADPELLRIIVDNLVMNALEARGPAEHEASDGGRPTRIVVRVVEGLDADDTRVEVSDDGPGIAREHRDAVFEPLRTEKGTGLGLGLPIARALARALGGDLRIAPREGYTTTFALRLPHAP